MANSCMQLCGFVLSCLGWIGTVIATTTNDWVFLCKYSLVICRKMEELGIKGPWSECFFSSGVYHCTPFSQILELPVYIQMTRALMVTGSILGLLAVGVLLMSMPCIRLDNEDTASKNKRAAIGGIVVFIVGVCVSVATVWFPIGVLPSESLMSFGFSLYAGWAGAVLSLLGGALLMCCSSSPSRQYGDGKPMYYTKPGMEAAKPTSSTHAKSAHV
ncbi:claudin-11a [Stigmatopora nigra]